MMGLIAAHLVAFMLRAVPPYTRVPFAELASIARSPMARLLRKWLAHSDPKSASSVSLASQEPPATLPNPRHIVPGPLDSVPIVSSENPKGELEHLVYVLSTPPCQTFAFAQQPPPPR